METRKGFTEITGVRGASGEEGADVVGADFGHVGDLYYLLMEYVDGVNLRHALHAARLAPEDGGWVHDVEGPDDMPAHVKTMFTGVSLHVPVRAGVLALGTWQGIYVAEHRARPHRREVVLQFVGTRR